MLWHAFIRKKSNRRIVTLYETDRLTLDTWHAFRRRCDDDGEPWIDALARLLEQHATRGKDGGPTNTK